MCTSVQYAVVSCCNHERKMLRNIWVVCLGVGWWVSQCWAAGCCDQLAPGGAGLDAQCPGLAGGSGPAEQQWVATADVGAGDDSSLPWLRDWLTHELSDNAETWAGVMTHTLPHHLLTRVPYHCDMGPHLVTRLSHLLTIGSQGWQTGAGSSLAAKHN